MPPGLNSNLMVLIPKVEGGHRAVDFRPIVMSNFIFKVITKILANKLGKITSRIISPNQYGFIPGRSIHESIAMASEGVNLLSKRCYGGNLAIKIDIKKAFDTLDWGFLRTILLSFGFCSIFMDWILNILSSARIPIHTPAGIRGYFSCSRGVRQGDPLSPLLFCSAEDFLSRYLRIYANSGTLAQMRYTNNVLFPSHMFYADDILLFCTATLKNMRMIRDTFLCYGNLSGQKVN